VDSGVDDDADAFGTDNGEAGARTDTNLVLLVAILAPQERSPTLERIIVVIALS